MRPLTYQDGAGEGRFPEEAEVLVRLLDEAAADAASTVRPAKRKRSPKQPARWEYHVEFLSHAPEPIAFRQGDDVEVELLEQRLNELGTEGWELVGYGPSPFRVWSRQPDPRMIAVFKRQARELASDPAA